MCNHPHAHQASLEKVVKHDLMSIPLYGLQEALNFLVAHAHELDIYISGLKSILSLSLSLMTLKHVLQPRLIERVTHKITWAILLLHCHTH